MYGRLLKVFVPVVLVVAAGVLTGAGGTAANEGAVVAEVSAESRAVATNGIFHNHSLWLNASNYAPVSRPPFGAGTTLYFGFGHRYPVDDFLEADHLRKFSIVGPDGDEKELTPGTGGFLATRVKLDKPGVWQAVAATKTGFYTMYVDKGRIHHKLGPKTGLENVILSLYYEQYAKALINVDEPLGKADMKPLGDKLEIVLLKSNVKGCGGAFLNIQVLFDGKPAMFCPVFATYSGFSTTDDFACATMTDSQGKAGIRLTHWGPWLIKARLKKPASDDMRDKCDEMAYTASLTLEAQ